MITSFQLNEQQEIAADHVDGPCLVIAVPGSGKTRTLTERTARLVTGGADPNSILSITFTNKAANEMKERISKRLGGQHQVPFVGTFHALCVQILRKFGHELGYTPCFTILDANEQKDVINQVARKAGRPLEKGSLGFVANIINNYREDMVDDFEELVNRFDKQRHLADIGTDYIDHLRASNIIDFSGLLSETIRLLDNHPDVLQRIQARFQYVQVDEVQDTNHAQFYLAELLTQKHSNLFIVGDPDQSVYAWRGARPGNINAYVQKHPDCRMINIYINYRSTPQIVKKAASLIGNNANRLADKLETINDDGDDVKCFDFRDQHAEAQWVAENSQRLIDNGYDPSSIVVLYRINKMSEPLEQAFTRLGIEYEVVGGYGFYDRKEIKDCLAMLRFLTNPKDGVAFHRLASVVENVGDVTVGKIENLAEQKGVTLPEACEEFAANTSNSKISKSLRNLVEAFKTVDADAPVATAVDSLVEGLKYSDYLGRYDVDSCGDRSENVKQLVDSAAHFSSERGKIPHFLQNVSLVTASDKDSRDGSVTLMSLHAVKGLEFPIVFMVGVEENTLPHYLALKESKDGLEEERRLCYVGMTRAQQLLRMSYCRFRTGFRKNRGSVRNAVRSSRFLHEAGLLSGSSRR